MARVNLESTLTCPHCGHVQIEQMPEDRCTYFYKCVACHAVLRPNPGDCCVFCSFGSIKCPSMQANKCSGNAELLA